MINEKILAETLVSVWERLQVSAEIQQGLLVEVAAIRETLRELLGERFSTCLPQHQASQIAKSVATEVAVKKLDDETIQILKDELIS
jgi:hypothetical protein